jgi:hypothetical protein
MVAVIWSAVFAVKHFGEYSSSCIIYCHPTFLWSLPLFHVIIYVCWLYIDSVHFKYVSSAVCDCSSKHELVFTIIIFPFFRTVGCVVELPAGSIPGQV